MSEKNKSELLVAALENGTVIDHIPSDKVFDVVNLLGLANMKDPVTIGSNLQSKKMGTKGIIKIANKFFSDEECSRLSVVAPNIKLSIIRDYEVVEKSIIQVPNEVCGIVRCPNPKCITNHEPMQTVFRKVSEDGSVFRCKYCNKDVERENIKLL